MPDRYDKTPKPVAETEEGKKRLNAYYLALGRFTDRFARVEQAVHTVLSHYAKLPPAAARALLSGVRVDETKNRLLRLHDEGLMSDPDWKDAEPIFQQLAVAVGMTFFIMEPHSSPKEKELSQTLQWH
jgi:hypothetical protein